MEALDLSIWSAVIAAIAFLAQRQEAQHRECREERQRLRSMIVMLARSLVAAQPSLAGRLIDILEPLPRASGEASAATSSRAESASPPSPSS